MTPGRWTKFPGLNLSMLRRVYEASQFLRYSGIPVISMTIQGTPNRVDTMKKVVFRGQNPMIHKDRIIAAFIRLYIITMKLVLQNPLVLTDIKAYLPCLLVLFLNALLSVISTF